MKINEITRALESMADPFLQESYDNAGLITGDPLWDCTGVLCTLDATVDVIREAISRQCNLIVAHHPILFRGLKKINGKSYVEQALVTAIKNDIAIYAIHTNLDHVGSAVNGRIASKLGLANSRILQPREQTLKKLYTFVPADHAEPVRQAIFGAGAGQIGQYSECSFNTEGTGTFTPGERANPFVGTKGLQHREKEIRMEMVFPSWLEHRVINAMRSAHPYEEVAYDLVSLSNTHPDYGSGLIGELGGPEEEGSFLDRLKALFQVPVIRHTALTGKKLQRIAVCGGAGSFLISKALAEGADAYITADIRYHEFFDAENRLLLCDVGHYESEQYTTDLLQEFLQQKFPTFAVLKTEVKTNPVYYHR